MLKGEKGILYATPFFLAYHKLCLLRMGTANILHTTPFFLWCYNLCFEVVVLSNSSQNGSLCKVKFMPIDELMNGFIFMDFSIVSNKSLPSLRS